MPEKIILYKFMIWNSYKIKNDSPNGVEPRNKEVSFSVFDSCYTPINQLL